MSKIKNYIMNSVEKQVDKITDEYIEGHIDLNTAENKISDIDNVNMIGIVLPPPEEDDDCTFARDAAKELLLRLGKDDTGLKTELGPIIASFYFNTPIKVQSIVGQLGAGEGEYDVRLDCGIIKDERHDLVLHVWENGRCVVTEGRHPKMVAMAAVYWQSKFKDLGITSF